MILLNRCHTFCSSLSEMHWKIKKGDGGKKGEEGRIERKKVWRVKKLNFSSLLFSRGCGVIAFFLSFVSSPFLYTSSVSRSFSSSRFLLKMYMDLVLPLESTGINFNHFVCLPSCLLACRLETVQSKNGNEDLWPMPCLCVCVWL